MKYTRSLYSLALIATLGMSLSACGGKSAASAPTSAPATNPAQTACVTASEVKTYSGDAFVCTAGADQRLVWLPESESKKVIAKAAADKAAADKVAADKAAADRVAADKAAADKVAADKAAADKVAADKAAADKIAADQLAAQQAAKKVVPAAPVAPAAPTDVYYANCTAAKAAGAAPIRAGSPGYRSALDRDGDGIACDK